MLRFVRHVVFALPAIAAALPVAAGQHLPAGEKPEAQPYGVMFALPAASAADGSLELEVGSELTSERWFMVPTALKFTPSWGVPGLRHAEFALAFDSIQSFPEGGHRNIRFGDALTAQVRKPVYRRGAYSLAVGPWATLSLEGEGKGAGLRTMASYAAGRNHLHANLNLGGGTGHVHSRAEVQADWYRAMAGTGHLAHLFASFGAMYQALSGLPGTVSFAEGLAYQLRPNLELDAAWHQQHLNQHVEHQFWLGLTANVGRLQK